MTEVLNAVRDSGLPDAWVGAGVLRDLVWGELYGTGFRPAKVHDIDVAFYDPRCLDTTVDTAATLLLGRILRKVPWEATNQAAVHLWYGRPVAPLASIPAAVATWPETATSVAVRLTSAGLQICAPYGLDDLLAGIWRRNPARITVAESRARLRRHQPAVRWSGVRVIDPGDSTRT